MATITSTIKLVDQMTPTLNKISKAIDNVNAKSKSLGSVKTWNGFNTGVRNATKGTHNLYNALRRTVFMVGMLRGLKGVATVSDTMMNANARINNITGDMAKTKYYMDAIYQSAQRSRSAFMDTANSVGKLATLAGSAFGGSMEQVIAFTELMNKLFAVSGASAAESSNAMYQLTQAMAAGKLQGDEMRSILENAPMLAQKIADKLGVAVGELKQLGADGKISADLIKEALFDAADEIEEKFENMPKTIGQTWTEISNYALNAFRPVIDRIQQFINSPIFEKFKSKLFRIIDGIANAVIRLFNAFETPRVQNAISKICNALGVLWQIALDVGNVMVNVATWICDNWSWIGQIVYAVIAAVLLYKAVMLVVSAAVVIANIAQGISAWIGALMAGQAWAWVILIIVALVAIIFGAVAAWNYFTDSSVSAVGVLFGAVMFVIACIWDLLVAVWDVLGTCVDIVVFVGKILWQTFLDICETVAYLIRNAMIFILNLLAAIVAAIDEVGGRIWDTLVWVGQVVVALGANLFAAIGNIFVALGQAIGEIGVNIWNTILWLIDVFKAFGLNISDGMSQLCQNLPGYWEYFKAATVEKFWSLVVGAGTAFNSLLTGASDIARKMVTPFEKFANAVIEVLNDIIRAWNEICSTLTFTIPGFSFMGYQVWEEQEIHLIGGGFEELNPVSWDDWDDPSGIDLSGANSHLSNAQHVLNAALANLNPINWNTHDIPNYGDYVDWSSVGNAWNEGMGTFDYTDIPEYDVDWSGTWGAIVDAFNSIDFLDMSGIWNGSDYGAAWNEFMEDLDQTWNSDDYWNPLDAFNQGYGAGEALENGINGLVDGIGGLLESLFGSSNNESGYYINGDWFPYDANSNAAGVPLPESLEDLLNGSGGSGNPLGAIADNTGSTAGSAANIEDVLDLSEEQLELLHQLAEQEVVNHFTTAEIHVDMTNNNNINSSMDLDGIVTHLSNQLYEELGVVASGVHY